MRGIFEGSANRGWKTRERFDSPAWGFYELKSEDHYQEGYGGVRVEPLEYAALLGMDHKEAMNKVKEYNDAVAEAILAQG